MIEIMVDGVAGDQDPGHGPITSQAATGLRGQGPHSADVTAQPMRVAEQAVQVQGDGQLGADPTGRWQPAALQGPPSQLGQGVGGALAAAAGVASVGRAGQRLQGGQQGTTIF
jgi:hypothetical protein